MNVIKSLKRVGALTSLKMDEMFKRNKVFGFLCLKIAKIYDKVFRESVVDKQIEKTINVFKTDLNQAKLKWYKKEIWQCREQYRINAAEYFLFGFENKSDKERNEFVGNKEKELLCIVLNKSKDERIFLNKWQTYNRFKRYYKREVILISSEKERERFEKFCRKHTKVIVKFEQSSKGKGIFVIDVNEGPLAIENGWKNTMKSLSVGRCVVVEQYVEQVQLMAQYNASSVNTVRFVTFKKGSDVIKMFALFRTGRKESVVDNGGSGGVLAAIDLKTGRIISEGIDDYGHRFIEHPDSHVKFEGFCIPEWEQAIKLSNTLANIVPEQKYVGWDLAYTEDGWVMIEGNSRAQFIGIQSSLRKGIRPLIRDTFYQEIKRG